MKPNGAAFLSAFLLLAGLAAGVPVLRAQTPADAPRKELVLPKSARAAAYVLGRLSNKELTEAPRSEFVYVALLGRPGLDRKYRLEALNGLAQVRNSDVVTEWVRGLTELAVKGEDALPVLREIVPLVFVNPPAALAAHREALEKLTQDPEPPLVRQAGFAALITADGTADQVWTATEGAPAQRAQLLLGVSWIRDAKLRATLYARVEPLLHQAEPAEIRRAAIEAIPAIPGHDADTFHTLAALVKSGTEVPAAVASLQRLPRTAWPAAEAAALVQSLLTYLQGVPVEQRTESAAVGAVQFATDLTTLLPAAEAQPLAKSLRALGVSSFVLRTLREQMLYSQALIVVGTGKPVQIILQNDDSMPHNLVIIAPGSLEEIGTIAEKLPPEPDAQGRLYIPASPKVLYATALVDGGQQGRLSFTAPETPGEYQYVCTFPGHWRRMTGILAVVPDVEEYLATHVDSSPKITEWKLEDLAADLAKEPPTGNAAAGREHFAKLGCQQCHKLGTEGYAYGPDLTDVLTRYKKIRADVVRQILEPSLVMADRYKNIQFQLKDGDELQGMIVSEEADQVTVQSGPTDALIQKIPKANIKERQPLDASLMPVGLLNTLSKEQILDLVAYIEAGGQVTPGEHHHP